MKKISKKASMAVMGFATLGILGVAGLAVSATSPSSGSGDNLAARLATKFGLNKEDVSKEIDSFRSEERGKRESEVQARIEASLQKKVDDGAITAEQKTAIEVKLKEVHQARESEHQANMNSGKKLSREEMKLKMDANKNEMDAWLKEQGINIDLKDVLPAHDKGHHISNENKVKEDDN